MPDEETEPTPEPEQQQGSKAVRELRATVDRLTEDNKQLKADLAETRAAQRTAGLTRAGVKPDSILGEAVLAVADRDGIYSADDIHDVVRVMQAEARGELEGAS